MTDSGSDPAPGPETIAARWTRLNGRPAGFDYMRLVLATLVLLAHSHQVTYGTEASFALWHGPAGLGLQMILPMFFSLSGFLVCGSLERTPNLRKFLTLRIIRIYPALCVEVFVSGVLIGPLVTVLPVGDYFSSHVFYEYWFNTVGYIHYILPGVFQDNPFQNVVNASLWTVPYELECYAALSLLVLIGFRRSLVISAIMFAACTVVVIGVLQYTGDTGIRPGGTYGRVLVLCFLAGTLLFRMRDHLPYSAPFAMAAAVLGMVLLRLEYLYCIAPLFVAYLTVWLGMLNPRRSIVISSGDYSYGIYLYAGPIQQSVVWALGPANSFLANAALSIPITAAFAMLSWHLVEKPFLKVKRYLVR